MLLNLHMPVSQIGSSGNTFIHPYASTNNFFVFVSGSDILELEVARTSSTLTATTTEEKFVLISGFLSRRGSNDRWHQRWFTLKNDNCLYYFKSQTVGVQLPQSFLMILDIQYTVNVSCTL